MHWGVFFFICDLLTECFSWKMCFLFHSVLHAASWLTRTASINSKSGGDLERFLHEEFTDLGKVIVNNIKYKDVLNVLWHEINIIILRTWKIFNGFFNPKTFQPRFYNKINLILKSNSKYSGKAKSTQNSFPKALYFMCFLKCIIKLVCSCGEPFVQANNCFQLKHTLRDICNGIHKVTAHHAMTEWQVVLEHPLTKCNEDTYYLVKKISEKSLKLLKRSRL